MWIPDHAGIARNEIVDKKTKSASVKIPDSGNLSLMPDLKQTIQMAMRGIWQN